MKRLIIVVTCVAALAATMLLSALGRVPPSPSRDRSVAFDGLPVDQPRRVELGRPQLESDEPTLYSRRTASALGIDLDGAMRRETADQIKDWLFMTVLSASRLSPSELNHALYDLPPVRRGHFERIAKFDYGDTRARVIGNGDVIALVPRSMKEQRIDALAQILDEERKNTGAIAGKVQVVEYELAPDLLSATLTRRAEVDGSSLFTAEAGYVEGPVASLADLMAFVAAIDDLTYARVDSDTVTLGGRRLQARRSRNIRVEDIAAIWQSEESPAGRRHGSGFSLDPAIEFGKLRQTFAGGLSQSLAAARISPPRIQSMEAALIAKDIDRFLSAFRAGCIEVRSESLCDRFVRRLVMDHQFQAARYDGSLQGTEVGMVLFYTDLLMKLWSLDYDKSTPRAVAGFPNEVGMEVAAIYRTEVEDFPGTRLWLGSLEDGYQTARGRQELLFARVATRVFAVPNDLLTGRDRTESTEPHVYDRTFMTWWNDHYQEVARYEPEYERLNEIMKWSQLIVWLNTADRGHLLDFLRSVPVDRSHRFTSWVQAHPELTFRNWSSIEFKPAGYEGSTTEALAILESPPFHHFGQTNRWRGGVTLARRTEFLNRAALTDDIPLLARRARLDYGKSNVAGGELRTAQGIEYKLRSATTGTASTVARVPTAQRLRGLVSEFRHGDLERTIVRNGEGFLVRARAVKRDIGEFHVTRTADGFRAGWRARAVDRGQAIARRASRADDLATALAADRDVQAVVKLANDDFLVKAVDADRWMKVTRAADDSRVVRTGYDARISGIGSGARNLDVAWLDDAVVAADLKQVGWLRIDPARTRGGTLWAADARGPPAGATPRKIQYAGGELSLFDEAGGSSLLRGADLPAALRDDPTRLRALIRNADSLQTADVTAVSALEQGDYGRAARALARDPGKFRAGFQARLAEEQRVTARLIEDGHFLEARLRTDALLSVWGEHPELRLQRALAQLGERDAQGAARTLDAGFKRPLNQQYFDEINHRLANPGLSAVERENLTTVERIAEWRSKAASGQAHGPGDLAAVADGDVLRLEYRADKLAAQPADMSKFAESRAVLYVEDTPGLNNIDWSPSTLHATLNGLVRGGRVDVRLLSVNLSQYSPTSIVEAQTRTSLRRVSPRMVNGVVSPGCSAGDYSEDDRQGCHIYIVRMPTVSGIARR